jgi:DNA polymerase-1
MTQRVLIIDQLNLFFRNYIVNPSISTNGNPIGGLKGCIQSLQKLVRETKPDKIYICWDGEGGSAKRKLIKKDYKAGRKAIRLNRAIRNLNEQEEFENKLWQQSRIVEYYNEMPIAQFRFKSTEADDVIAHLCQMPDLSDHQKIIVSSDKDFFQLLDGKTVLYRPIQKEILNMNNIVDKFNIHPCNFAMARAMAGDKSDNIDGIGGAGLKTVAKRFPFLCENQSATLGDILDYAEHKTKKSNVKIYQTVLEKENILDRNYQMMQLYAPSLSISAKKHVREVVRDFTFEYSKTKLITMMAKDSFGESNFIDLYAHFNKMCLDKQ